MRHWRARGQPARTQVRDDVEIANTMTGFIWCWLGQRVRTPVSIRYAALVSRVGPLSGRSEA